METTTTAATTITGETITETTIMETTITETTTAEVDGKTCKKLLLYFYFRITSGPARFK